MDTDDLSLETYSAIIDPAGRFHNELTLQFGLLASDCENDNEFLDQSEAMIKEWLSEWDLEELKMDIFFDDLPIKQDFKKVLVKILTNIEKVRKIPIEQREFDF